MRISDWSSDVCSSDLNQCHRQDRRRGHRIGFGKGERREQPALLSFEREHRDERQRDDQQAEEQRRADFGGGFGDDDPAHLAVKMLVRVILLPALALLEIGRASCRERVCPYVYISVVAGSLKK